MSYIKNIANLWFDGRLSENEARRSCELQGLDFSKVELEYGSLYEMEQCANEGYSYDK